MDLSIDELLLQRQEEIKSQQTNFSSDDDDDTQYLTSKKERDHDFQMMNIIQTKLDFPFPPTPFYYIFDKFDIKPDGDIPTFPRLTKISYQLLQFFPKKLVFSETLVFTIIQEMIIHPSVSNELGKLLIRYCRHNLPNYQIDFRIWLNFVFEISISYPNILVYVLGIVHQKFFKQEFTDNYSNDEVIIILLSSLLCHCVVENENFIYILSSLEEYFESPISPKVFEIFSLSFDHVDPKLFFAFPSLLPSNANSIQILKQSSYSIICRLFGIKKTNNIDAIIEKLNYLQEVCQTNDPLIVQSTSIAITYIEKLCFCLLKDDEITIEQLEKIKSSLFLQKNVDPTELTEIKEKLHFTRTQIDSYIEIANKKL